MVKTEGGNRDDARRRESLVESELERLRKKVENFPSASAYNRLAELVRVGGDIAGAEQVCRRCIKEFPRNGQAYVILAEIELANGRKDEAIKNLLTAVERDNRSYTAHRMLADHYLETAHPLQALQHLRQILTFKPNDPTVLQKIEHVTGKPLTATVIRQVAGASNQAAPGRPLEPAPLANQMVPASDGLSSLCAEAGVRGALIADEKGRVVVSQRLSAQQEDLLAALAAEITKASQQALSTVGQDQLSTWTMVAEQGQVLAFRREKTFSVVILAEPGVRPAMLEIRARQALVELGAG
jgi:predicted regulator of Ras-like GTPase activity (Roadblock/LC7/MglB family)